MSRGRKSCSGSASKPSRTGFFPACASSSSSAIDAYAPVPITPSISGISARNSSPKRCERQPATMSCWPSRFFSACSRIVSVDSAFAGSMNAQVLMTTASASAASGTSDQPAAPSFAIITSLSTRFFAHPRETKETV